MAPLEEKEGRGTRVGETDLDHSLTLTLSCSEDVSEERDQRLVSRLFSRNTLEAVREHARRAHVLL